MLPGASGRGRFTGRCRRCPFRIFPHDEIAAGRRRLRLGLADDVLGIPRLAAIDIHHADDHAARRHGIERLNVRGIGGRKVLPGPVRNEIARMRGAARQQNEQGGQRGQGELEAKRS